MGKRNNNRKGQRFGRRNNNRNNNNRSSWVEIPKHNDKWETYYKAQGLIPEDEWDKFKAVCQKQLPLTFRITGSRKHAKEILHAFKERHLPDLLKVDINEIKREQEEKRARAREIAIRELEATKKVGQPEESAEGETEAAVAVPPAAAAAIVQLSEDEEIEKPVSLPWYPNELAWQVNVPKSIMKKNENYKKTQRFLVIETEVGNISRQEAVSMIPPLVLDIKPEHYVLDMCAAPGSKTAQLIESLHDFGDNDSESNEIPSGFVMANDSDYKRSHMLVHQVKRLNSPNFVVVNHDGQMLPKFKLANRQEFVKFDRILCDVPCTGDGTMRKNVTVWKEWSIGNALGMHSLQLNILNRGLQLLKPGGRLVYSTCSLSPIENEAVIAAALQKWGDEVSLVNCDDKLPGLVRRNGVRSWKVFNKEGAEIESLEKLEETRNEVEVNKKIPATAFPPSEEEAEKLNLNYCMRVYPHLQNTGGFFITVLEKKGAEPAREAENDKKRTAEETEEASKKQKVKGEVEGAEGAEGDAEAKQQKPQQKFKLVPLKKEKLPRDANEEPFIFLDPKNEILQNCWDFYSINDSFPKDSTLVRNATGAPVRSVYFVAPVIRDIIASNEMKLKFIHSGLKLFVSQKSSKAHVEAEIASNEANGTTKALAWRLQNESLMILKAYLGPKRQVSTNKLEVLKTLLLETFPSFSKLKSLSEDFYNQLQSMEEGCCFLNVERGQDGETLFLPIWKGRNCVNLMLNKHDTFEILYRIFNIETDRDTSYKQDTANEKNSKIDIKETSDEKVEKTAEKIEEEKEAKEEEAKEEAN